MAGKGLSTLGLMSTVSRIFRDPLNSNIKFHILSASIKPSDFTELASAIWDDRMFVEQDSKAKLDAEYHYGPNKLVVKNANITDVLSEALIIHEGVHAINDMKKRGALPAVDDEVAGYVAQALYVRGHGAKKGQYITHPVTTKQDIFIAAFALAERILDKKSYWKQIITLREKIYADPDYAANLKQRRVFDGLGSKT